MYKNNQVKSKTCIYQQNNRILVILILKHVLTTI